MNFKRVVSIFRRESWVRIRSIWSERASAYQNADEAKEWFLKNYDKITSMFEIPHVRDAIFGPIIQKFSLPEATTDARVRSTIAAVAIANAVMAGLPGKLGVGVYVAMALEIWMAIAIARLVGIKIEKTTDIFEYVPAFAIVIGTVGWGFVHLLRFVFSLVVYIPGVPATFVAEIIVTNFVGVLFWLGFEEARSSGSFMVPRRMFNRARRLTVELVKHQTTAIKGVITPSNLKDTATRMRAWFTGDLVLPQCAPAEVFLVGAIAALRQGTAEKLDGPLGDIFLQSIRDRWSSELANASVDKIAEKMSTYDSEQIVGVINVIKGKMFEHLVQIHENNDGDDWYASLHGDESYPGSDVVFHNIETGEVLEVSLKAVSSPSLIEHALARYPDIPVLTTNEMSDVFGSQDGVSFSTILNDELTDASKELFSDLISTTSAASNRMEAIYGVSAGTAAITFGRLWPFVAAYMRGKLSREQLTNAFVELLGDEGKKLAGRVVLAAVFGPIYVWYLLGTGIVQMASGGSEDDQKKTTEARRLVYRKEN